MGERRGSEIIFYGQRMDCKDFEGPLWPFLKRSILSHGTRTALVNPYTNEEWSFTKVVLLAQRLARGLIKAGSTQGRTLSFVAPNSVESALLMLGTFAAGGALHATNPAFLPGEIRRQLLLVDSDFVVTVPELLAHVREAVAGTSVRIILLGPRQGYLTFDDLLTLGSEDVTLPTEYGDPADSTAILLFSSGTTGVPKGVEITQRNVRAVIHSITLVGEEIVNANDVAIMFLPLFHVAGLVNGLLGMLARGCRQVMVGKFDFVEYLTFLSKYQATLLYAVPPIAVAMLSFPNMANFDLSHVRQVIFGAAPLGKETENLFSQKFGRKCLQGYGMTENAIATVSTNSSFRSGSCGFLIPGMEMKVVDSETGKSLGANQTGVIFMRGPMRMKGYRKNPQATAATIDDQGWLDSGDVGYIDSDGFLFIVDRKKELIKFKAEQVPPAMLEDVLLSHPGISDAAVIGRPDDMAGELPMAFVVKATGRADLTEKEVKDFVAKNVPSYMQLRGGVVFKKDIPKSPSGKILRRLLRDELKTQLNSKL